MCKLHGQEFLLSSCSSRERERDFYFLCSSIGLLPLNIERYCSREGRGKEMESNREESKIPMETETLEQKPKTPETILKPIIKLAQIDEKINKSFRFEKDGNNNFNDLKDKSQFSSALLWPADQNETGVKSQLTAFTKQRSKSNLKVINEKDLQRSHEKLQAHVFENGETVDINEGLKNKVRTYFMLNVDGMDNGILEQKDRKREYIKRYAKYINENIDENIRGINVKLEKLNKVKVNSFHR